SASPMQVVLIDPQGADRNEVYVRLGVPPTRSDDQYRSSDPASAVQRVTVASATAGPWYILVYREAVLASGPVPPLATTGGRVLRPGHSVPRRCRHAARGLDRGAEGSRRVEDEPRRAQGAQ